MIVSIKEYICSDDRQYFQLIHITWAIIVLMALSACSDKITPSSTVRVVKTITITAEPASIVDEFAGEIQPQTESKLGFRVNGKIIARNVNVGDSVKPQQILMQLDAQDLKLIQQQADAALKSALSSRDLALAELTRYQELREKNFVNQATLDAKQTAYQSAQSSVEQAQASYKNQTNQTSYTVLKSDIYGVVTQVHGEVGQVVAAGTPVINVAQMSHKDVVINVPENKVDTLKQVQSVYIRLWTQPDKQIVGTIREISPVADSVTRTYQVKITLPETSDEVKLGMTAYVSLINHHQHAAITLPLSALYHDKGNTAVWLVKDGKVTKTPVTLSAAVGNDIIIASGLQPGEVVVTAGVNMLQENQPVKPLDSGEETAAEDKKVLDDKSPI